MIDFLVINSGGIATVPRVTSAMTNLRVWYLKILASKPKSLQKLENIFLGLTDPFIYSAVRTNKYIFSTSFHWLCPPRTGGYLPKNFVNFPVYHWHSARVLEEILKDKLKWEGVITKCLGRTLGLTLM